ncbi:MAG: hypothetical protein AB7J34_06890 [Limisphaerales bacterium]
MILPTIILSLAAIAGLAAWIMLVVGAFRRGQNDWGVALIVTAFIPLVGPIVGLIFIIRNWEATRKAAGILAASLVFSLVGTLVAASQVRKMAEEMVASGNLQNVAIQLEDLQQAGESVESSPDTPAGAQGTPSETGSPSSPDRPVPPPKVARARSTPPPRRSPRPVEAPDTSQAPGTTPPTQAAASPPPAANAPARGVDERYSPLTVETLGLGDPNPNRLRTIRVRAGNRASQAIREARLALSYHDAQGRPLGQWTTIHFDPEGIVAARTTNEFTVQGYFVPQFTKIVRIEVESVAFADGSRWPARHSALTQSQPRPLTLPQPSPPPPE